MDIYILDTDFNKVRVIDNYISLIWNEKYYEPGDFQLTMPFSKIEDFSDICVNNYVRIPDSEYVMIIETINIVTSSEEGYKITISGKDLTSILSRRVTMGALSYSSYEMDNGTIVELKTPKYVMDDLMKRSFGVLAAENRKVSKLTWDFDSDVNANEQLKDLISDKTYPFYFDCVDILSVFTALAKEYRFGFKIVYDDVLDKMVMKLYKGVDRSYDQTDNEYVIFSENMSNIYNTTYNLDYSSYKSVAIIVTPADATPRFNGDPQLDNQFIMEQTNNDDMAKTGLLRREKVIKNTATDSTPTEDEKLERALTEYRPAVIDSVENLFKNCADEMINAISDRQSTNKSFKLKKVKDETELQEHQASLRTGKDKHSYIYMIQDDTPRKDNGGFDASIMNCYYNELDGTKHWKLYFPKKNKDTGEWEYSPCYDLGATPVYKKDGTLKNYKQADKINKYNESQINDALERWYEYINDKAWDAALSVCDTLGSAKSDISSNYILSGINIITTPEDYQNLAILHPENKQGYGTTLQGGMEPNKIYAKPDTSTLQNPSEGSKPMEQIWIYFEECTDYNWILPISNRYYIGAVGGDFVNSLFLSLARNNGKYDLTENQKTESFEGELDTSIQYVYGKDYSLGDIVEIQSVLGQWAPARVTGIIRSYSSSGITAIPSFTMLSKEDTEYRKGSFYRYQEGMFEMLEKDYKY